MKSILIINMILAVANIVGGMIQGNWDMVVGWGVALIWELAYFDRLRETK